jgi:Trk K+ transport system NAD-binding subunit
MTVRPGCPVDRRTVGEVEATYDISIVAIYGDTTSEVRPEPEVTLRAGDRLLVLGSLEKLGPLNAAVSAGSAAST